VANKRGIALSSPRPLRNARARSRNAAMSKQAPTSDAVQALLELRDKLEKNGRFLTMVRDQVAHAQVSLARTPLRRPRSLGRA
jgi:hypothetical protein